MPQFDFAHVFWPQFIWLGLFFGVLYFAVVRTTLPRLGKVMDARENAIAGDLEAARQAKTSADAIDTRYHAELDAAREQARQTIAEAKASAAKAGEGRLAAAASAADARIAEAETRIARAADAAREELRAAAAESAQAIVAKLTGGSAALAAARAKVDPLIGG